MIIKQSPLRFHQAKNLRNEPLRLMQLGLIVLLHIKVLKYKTGALSSYIMYSRSRRRLGKVADHGKKCSEQVERECGNQWHNFSL